MTVEAAPPATDAAEPRPRGRATDWVDDRLNPVLVKEVRQALQGKYFRWMFLITLLAATAIGVFLIVLEENPRNLGGRAFFVPMYACLSAAVHVFVPFSVFTSLGSEWEENTYDLLSISALRPRGIALGKLLAAGVQVLLYYSAFGPFLVFAFLLRGLDLTAVAVILAGTLGTSALLSCYALALSSLTGNRVLRVLLLTLLAGSLVQLTFGTTAAAFGIIREASILHDPAVRATIGGLTTAAALLAAFGTAIAASRLAHPEENRSTALRVLALLLAGGAGGWLLYFLFRVFPIPPADLAKVLPLMMLVPAGVLALPSVFFVTEPERLGRRVELDVPRSRLRALLVAPFLPGGGRGFLLLVLELGVLLAVGVRVRTAVAGADTSWTEFDQALLVALCYLAIYLGLPSALAASRRRELARLVGSRVAVPLLAVLALLVPSLLGLLLEIEALSGFGHLGNPVHVLTELVTDGTVVQHATVVVPALAGLVALLNLPRVVRGLREVLAASARRRRAAAGR